MTNQTEDLKNFIISLLDDKKAENIQIIDLGDSNPLTKYMIIASGRSTKNVSSMADFLSLELKKNFDINIGIEGLGSGQWVLVDCSDVIVHIFHPETRERFRLEEMWTKK